MAAFTTVDGTFIQLFINNQLIANSTDCKESIKRGKRKVTSKDDNANGFNRYEYTDGDISLSGSFLHTYAPGGLSTAALVDLARSRTKVSIRWGGTLTGQTYRTATGLLTSVELSAPLLDNATGSYSIDVDGDYSAAITIP